MSKLNVQTIPNEQVIGFDCDDTLILHREALPGEETVEIVDPYDNTVSSYVVHKPHVKLLKDRMARGCAILLWSQNGPKWAKAVADALKINPTLILGKPFMVVDDLPVEAWMGKRVYMSPDTPYGNRKTENLEEK
jgi:hypothetical protein